MYSTIVQYQLLSVVPIFSHFSHVYLQYYIHTIILSVNLCFMLTRYSNKEYEALCLFYIL